MEENNSQIIIYQTDKGETKLEVTFNDETVWLTQLQLSTLFGKSKKTISEHISNFLKKVNYIKKWLSGNTGQPLNMVLLKGKHNQEM